MIVNCTDTIPYASAYLSDLTSAGLGLIISTGIATLFTLIISALTFGQIYKNTEVNSQRYISWLLVGICPVIGVTSLAGLIAPRSSDMNTLLGAIYLSVSVVLFFRLIMSYMGGEKALCECLAGNKIPFSREPCCCCICLRNIYVTRRNIRRIKLMVYQCAVIRPLLLYVDTMMKLEEKTSTSSITDHPAKLVITVMTFVSMITGLMGLLSTFRLSATSLKYHGILPKFFHMKLVMIFCDPQAAIIRVIASTGAIPCSHIFYHPYKAATLTFILLCYEMTLLSILGFKQYGKKIPKTIHVEMEDSSKGNNSDWYNSQDKSVKYKKGNQEPDNKMISRA